MVSKLFSEVVGCLKLESVCSVAVGASSIQFVTSGQKITAITVCDFNSKGSVSLFVYSTELLVSVLSNCTSVEEEDGALKCTYETDKYKIVNTIQPLLADKAFYEIPEEWDTKVTVKLEVFKKFINLQPEAETSIYLSNGILHFSCSNSSCISVLQMSEIEIVKEGTAKVSVHFSSLKYLGCLLGSCEKVSVMYTEECFSIVLLFKDDVIHHRVIFNGIV